MAYKLEAKWKGKTVKSQRTFKTKQAAKRALALRIATVSALETVAVRKGNKKKIAKIEKVEHAVMKAKIVKVA